MMTATLPKLALLEQLAQLTPEGRRAVVEGLDEVTFATWRYDWAGLWARPEQLPPPGLWRVWLIVSGRGWGKSRTGAEWVRAEVEAGRRGQWAFVGATAGDVRDYMLEGDSGILRVGPPASRPEWEPSKRRLTWPNGATATLYSAEEPDQLRGPNCDGFWADELGKWKYPREAWDNLEFVMRAGLDPRGVVTTTPRPLSVLVELLTDPGVVTTRGHTYDNRANLAPSFLARMQQRYEGTRTGRQELAGELLADIEGAAWQRAWLDDGRVNQLPAGGLVRLAVAVDPEAEHGEQSAETGIIVVGKGADGHGYVLEDCSIRGTPAEWASAAVAAYHKWHANVLVAETNQGGEMVRQTIASVPGGRDVVYKGVRASHSKQARAEPIAALYEQGRVHHLGTFAVLEDQMCSWVAGSGPSPDRIDAAVWGFSELLLDVPASPFAWLTDDPAFQQEVLGHVLTGNLNGHGQNGVAAMVTVERGE